MNHFKHCSISRFPYSLPLSSDLATWDSENVDSRLGAFGNGAQVFELLHERLIRK